MTQNRSKLIVSTCGTSILTNNVPDELRKLLMTTANSNEKKLEDAQREQISSHIAARSHQLKESNTDQVKRLSAELNSLLTFYGADFQSSRRDQHILLHTDTYQGGQAAILLRDWLREKGLEASTLTFERLSTRSHDNFQQAMSELAKWAHETLPGYSNQGYEVVFNLTGGFKSINGFLQTVGMFYADRVIYLFESGAELLTIPRLPLTLSARPTIEANLQVFRRLACFGEIPKGEEDTIPETLLLSIEDHVGLSAWGELIWSEAKGSFYEAELLAVLSNRIRVTDAFQRDTRDLPPERLSILNHRLDDLACYLDSDQQNCPKSLDFKKLRGKPVKGSTHECDAWSDLDARRIFGHFEDEVLVLDRLGKHL
ncbi:MAG: putative CRISPR-associated protein [Vulcanimicrobiota bacterium]